MTLAPASIRRVHAVLRRSPTVVVRWGLISTNPALMVDPPSLTVNEVRPAQYVRAAAAGVGHPDIPDDATLVAP